MRIYHPPPCPLVPTHGAEDGKAFLAAPDKHWKDGRPAKMLAERWVEEKVDGSFGPMLSQKGASDGKRERLAWPANFLERLRDAT